MVLKNFIKEYEGDKEFPNMHPDLVGFRKELSKIFPELIYTSGFRTPSQKVGKNYKTSRHNKGEAWDLEANRKVYDYLYNSFEGLSLLNKYGLGILDETDPETMKRTGATGAHFHVGKDTTLVPKAKERYEEFLREQQEQKSESNISIPIDEIQETTKDSLDPNYYMEDIINDSTSASQSKELVDLQKIFQMETDRKAKERDYLERLKTVSQQPPTQTEENYRQNNLDIEQLYNDSLYNYININTYQDGGSKNNPEEALKFLESYINSEKYKERLESSGYYPPVESKIRLRDLKSNKGFSVKENTKRGSQYFPEPQNFTHLDISQSERLNVPLDVIMAHEATHNINERYNYSRLNGYDKTHLINRLNKNNKLSNHDKKPTENLADINAFRYSLFKQGIYDTRKETFTEEHLNKAKKDFNLKRLLKNYSKEDLIWLMNNIAQQEKQEYKFLA